MAEIPFEEKGIVSADSLHMHKGEIVFLSHDANALHKVTVCLGWEAPAEEKGFAVDIDASAFLLNRDNRVRRDTDFVFYNNLETENGIVKHLGDNTTGKDIEGATASTDKEVIQIDLDNMPYDVEKVAIAVTIHNAEERQQSFGLVKGAYMRILSEADGRELAHFDLSEDASEDNAMVFGELVREGLGWKFKALGTGSNGGLYRISREYGVNVAPA